LFDTVTEGMGAKVIVMHLLL